MRTYFLTVLTALLSLMVPLFASAESGEGFVRITADLIVQDPSESALHASGDVRLKWQGYTLFADRVEYAEKNRTATATGSVKLLRGDDLLTSDMLKIFIGTGRGVATNSSLRTAQGNLRIKGAVIEKVADDRYRLEQGSFTTCDADPPSWKFSASDLDVTVDEYVTGRNVVFSVEGIPVFYTPYILFPVARERKSGLLVPKIGNSDKKGFFTNIPFYWVISPSAEATFDLDIQTKRGVGTGVAAKWLRSRGSHGDVTAYAIYDTELTRERANITSRIKEVITPDIEFNADINLATDRSFYQDFSEESGDYNRQALDSSLSLTKRWHSWHLAGEARILNNLDSRDNERTLQRLPELTLAGSGERIGTLPLYAGFGGRISNFYRREDVIGQRLVIQPTLTYYANLPEGVSLSWWGGYQQRLYNASNGEGEGEKGIGLAVAGARASASFTRLYEAQSGDLSRVRHTFIPGVDYSFIQERDQSQLPFFDYDDRVIGQNLVYLSLANSFTGRFDNAAGTEYRELLNVRLSQGYQISGGRRDLLNTADEHHDFTDIRLEATANPSRSLSVVTDNHFSPYSYIMTTSSLSASVNDRQGNAAGIGYRRIYGQLDYLEGNFSLNLLSPFVFKYTGRYSFDRREFLENYYVAEYRHQCWSVALSYRDRTDNNEFMVNFTLAGIGGLGKVNAPQ